MINEALEDLAIDIDTVGFDPSNARKHDAKNIEAIKASLSKFGQRSPIVVQKQGMIARAGNGRLEAAKALGWSKIAAIVVDESDVEATAFAIADNRTGELAKWDDDALGAHLQALEQDINLNELGFDDGDLCKFINPKDLLIDDDEVPDDAEAICNHGDLWILGKHRLFCGDSTEPQSYEKAIGKNKVDLCLTDPPYGLGAQSVGSEKNAYDVYVDTQDSLKDLAAKWVPLAIEHSETLVFSCGVTNQWFYPQPDWVICWFFHGHLGSPWGFSCWQPFLCYGRDPSMKKNRGRRPDGFDLHINSQSFGCNRCRPDAVYSNISANAKDINHPCPKPLALWAWMLERLKFDRKKHILDPFAGSGTTILAAEKAGFGAIGIEMSPAYCDIIIKRWESATGRKAELDG
jgi:DNA modification methylase